jgi:hypothetical protein
MYDTRSPRFPAWLARAPAIRLERVVLRRDVDDEVVAEDGDLQHDVVADARDLCEEEEREEARDAAEAGCEGAANWS